MMLRRLFWPFRTGLARRLTITNIMALLPLLMLAALLTRELFKEYESNQARAALGLTVRAAEPEINLIRAARTLSATLAAIAPDVLRSDEDCARVMDLAAASHPDFSLVGYISEDGMMRCGSGGRQYDFAGSDLLARMTESGGTNIALARVGPVSGVPILSVPSPVIGTDGDRDGMIVVSIPQHVLHIKREDLGDDSAPVPEALLTFDNEGQLLTTSVVVSRALELLPQGRELLDLTHMGNTSFLDTDYTGTDRSYAVVPLTRELFLLGVWNSEARSGIAALRISPFLIFGLVLISCFTAATLAADRLVTRHVRSLASAMEAFASGSRQSYRSTLHDPPAEIAVLAEAYDMMTETIQREEAELEDLLREKEYLLREVHHRTGNSMQLIASILRMHIRETEDPVQKGVLDHLYGRVMILSTVHLGLYRTSGVSSLDMQRLFNDVISRVDLLHSRPERSRSVVAEVESLSLPPQQAVPMALMLSEVLPAFYSAYSDEDADPVVVHLSMKSDHDAIFAIDGPAGALPRLNGTDGTVPSQIGARLLRNFVRQLDGEMDLITLSPERLRFEMRFVARAPQSLSEADPSSGEAAV
ncbi:sensor histidine kinase [Falsigemmobacter intermedius]|uniref:histidine kinase n=2 Tax=Falsigemmobacter intermedius TaxID=1553448 RepID=A0A444ME31_9RHOB|nr:sensor histidine kinase [Falsigemmobacter intermedius]